MTGFCSVGKELTVMVGSEEGYLSYA
jgi:hypothetical protein